MNLGGRQALTGVGQFFASEEAPSPSSTLNGGRGLGGRRPWGSSASQASPPHQEVLGCGLSLSCCCRPFPRELLLHSLASVPSRGSRPLWGAGRGGGPGVQSLVRLGLGTDWSNSLLSVCRRKARAAGSFPGEAGPPWSSFSESPLGFAGSPFSQENVRLERLLRRQEPRGGDGVKGCPEAGMSGGTMPRKVGGTPKTS